MKYKPLPTELKIALNKATDDLQTMFSQLKDLLNDDDIFVQHKTCILLSELIEIVNTINRSKGREIELSEAYDEYKKGLN